MPFKITSTHIPAVKLIEPQVFGDSRGFFMEVFKLSEFAAAGIAEPFVQANHSRSEKGVVRGLHFQAPPCAQGKLVRVLAGEIFDVAVDIRVGSPTYGKAVWETLSSENRTMLFIPAGFAHGFCVTSKTADVEYFCTSVYEPKTEAGIVWNDPALEIPWPVKKPVLSDKDKAYGPLAQLKSPFVFKWV